MQNPFLAYHIVKANLLQSLTQKILYKTENRLTNILIQAITWAVLHLSWTRKKSKDSARKIRAAPNLSHLHLIRKHTCTPLKPVHSFPHWNLCNLLFQQTFNIFYNYLTYPRSVVLLTYYFSNITFILHLPSSWRGI